MPGSALIGQTPLSEDDKLVYKALLELSPSAINPEKNNPFGPSPPHNASYESRSSTMITGTSVAIALVIVITSTRLLVRRFYTHAFGLDDWVIIPAAMACIVYLSLDIASESKGCLGKHLYECTYDELNWFVKLAYINEPIFYLCAFSIKTSITLANKRITGIASNKWRVVHWVYLSIILSLLPTTVFLNMFQCSPVATGYSLKAIGAMANPRQIKCLNRTAISLSTRILHIVTDFALLCVPIIILSRLQISTKKRFRLSIVFGVGGVSCIASVVRNVVILRPTSDLTWDYYTVYAWDVVDIFFATVVASLPALNALVDAILRKVKNSSLGSNSGVPLFSKLRSYARRGTNAQAHTQIENVSNDQGPPQISRSYVKVADETEQPITGYHINQSEPDSIQLENYASIKSNVRPMV